MVDKSEQSEAKQVAPRPAEQPPTAKSDPDSPREREVRDQGISTSRRTDVPRSVGGDDSGASAGGVGHA